MSDDKDGSIKINPTVIGAWIAVIIPLWSGIVYGVTKWQDIMKHSEVDLSVYVMKADDKIKELEAKIERTEILIAFYEDKADNLSESQKNKYELAKSRLARLQARRDEETGVVRN